MPTIKNKINYTLRVSLSPPKISEAPNEPVAFAIVHHLVLSLHTPGKATATAIPATFAIVYNTNRFGSPPFSNPFFYFLSLIL